MGDRLPGVLPLYVGCKICIGCRLERSRQWAVRSVHESMFHDENYFLTFTFNNKFCPANFSLDTKTVQKMWKRFRKAHPSMRFKYYMAGEYGENYSRPHYHASAFGLELPDLVPGFKSRDGFQMYSSPMLNRAWSIDGESMGEVYVAHLSFETAAYTARYICKKVIGEHAEDHYKKLGVMPERAWMSKGLGKQWYETYANETYRDGYVVSRGVPATPPATYTRWLKEDDPDKHFKFIESIKKSRDEQLKLIDDLCSGRHYVARAVKEASLRAGRLDYQR